MKLSPKQRRAILDQLDNIFYGLKARVLGRFFKGPRIYFEIVKRTNPLETIEGLFRYSMSMLYGTNAQVDDEMVESLAETTGNYVDAKRLQVQNRIMADIAHANTPKQALTAIKRNVRKTTDYIENLISNETRTTQAYAEKEGITQVAASIGIEDPTVAKLGVIDDRMCDNCRDLWHQSNIYKPKLYKLSDLKEGYVTDQKNPYPSVGPTHPNCRHILTFLPPNFDFDEKGRITFKAFGHDAYEEQEK